MKSSGQRLKLQMMHDVLDRQLESIENEPVYKTYEDMMTSQDRGNTLERSNSVERPSRPNKANEQKMLSSSASRKGQINDLEKKLMQLEKKMECIDLESSDNQSANSQPRIPAGIKYSEQKHSSSEKKVGLKYNFGRVNQFNRQEQEKIEHKNSSEEEDSQQQQPKQPSQRQPLQKVYTSHLQKMLGTKQHDQKRPVLTIKKTEGEDDLDLLRHKYPPQKSRRSTSNQRKTSQHLNRSNKSWKKDQKQNDNHSRNLENRSNKQRSSQKSLVSKDSNRSRSHKGGNSRVSESVRSMRGQQLQTNKETKKINNMEKQLTHYKRLAKKLQQKISDFQKMEIEYRKLKTNFAKSEQIRKQQKKLIENLRTRQK